MIKEETNAISLLARRCEILLSIVRSNQKIKNTSIYLRVNHFCWLFQIIFISYLTIAINFTHSSKWHIRYPPFASVVFKDYTCVFEMVVISKVIKFPFIIIIIIMSFIPYIWMMHSQCIRKKKIFCLLFSFKHPFFLAFIGLIKTTLFLELLNATLLRSFLTLIVC